MKEEGLNRPAPPKARTPKDLTPEILDLNQQGLGLTAIARKLGISRGSVYGILAKVRPKRSLGSN